jgi:polyadenylate-binding protein 2
MKQFRPRRPSNPYMGFRGRTPYAPPFAYAPAPYGYGYAWCTFLFTILSVICDSVGLQHSFVDCRKVPRFRMGMRYSPYY